MVGVTRDLIVFDMPKCSTSVSEILKWKRLMICKWREFERFHLTTLQDYMSATDSSTTGSMSDTAVLAQAT
jgi:hypothetical protein